MYIHICMYKITYACQLPAYLILGFICTSRMRPKIEFKKNLESNLKKD